MSIGEPVTPKIEMFECSSDNFAPQSRKKSSETKQILLPVSYKVELGWPKTETSRKTGGCAETFPPSEATLTYSSPNSVSGTRLGSDDADGLERPTESENSGCVCGDLCSATERRCGRNDDDLATVNAYDHDNTDGMESHDDGYRHSSKGRKICGKYLSRVRGYCRN